MIRNFIVATFFVFLVSSLFGQTDRVLGYWLTDGGESQVEIFKNSNGTYDGRLVWLKEPLDENGRPKVDKENPEARLRNRPLTGLVILRNFSYDAATREWKDGTIYDPKNGRTYDAFMWFDRDNKLNIKGFVLGMRMMGRSTAWTREQQRRN